MAAKKRRASPLDDPPTASSSSDEEEEEEPQKPSQQKPKENEVEEENQSSSEEEEDESEEEEEEKDQPPVLSQSSAKNPPPPPTTKSQPKPSSDSESESGTDSDEDEDDDSQPPNSKVKPLASKPMDQNPNPNSKTKAQTQTLTPSSPPPNKSGTKRAAENNNAHANANANANDSKRAKKKATDTPVSAASAGGSDDEMETEEDVKKSGEDSKKMFQRVWSEEDETTIVKGMADFISKTGNDPVKYINAFYEFVKKLLSFDATSTQLRQKIRRLKDKYNVAAQKAKKNGVGPNFSKPRDQKLYELSKKVWGNDSNEVEAKGRSNGTTPKSPKKEAPTKNTASAKKPARTKKPVPEVSEETESPEQVVAMKESVKGESDKEVALSEMFRYDKGVGIPGLNEAVVHRGLDFMDESKRAAMVAKWKEFRADEFQMFMRRSELVREQAALVWEAYQASNP